MEFGDFLDKLAAKIPDVQKHIAWGAGGFVAGLLATFIL